MRAKKLFSILLAMMLMLFTLFPIQAVLAETTNQPSQTTSTAEPPASSAVPTQRSDTPAPTSGAEPGVETPVDVSGQLGFFVQQYGLMVLLALLARSGRRKRTAESAQSGQTIAVMDMPGEPPILDVTEVGNVHNIGKRNYQQDAFGVSPLQDEKLRHSRGVLAVLADGMGGMTNSGELSQAAVLTALRSFPQAPGGTGETLASVAHSVLDMVQKRFTGSGSGSTLVLANIRDGKLDFLTIGDSRIALLRDGALLTLNREHNYAATLRHQAALGLIPWREVAENPRCRALTSYLGLADDPAMDFPAEAIPLNSGDKIVLMSDGVFGTLDDETLTRVLVRSPNVVEAAHKLEDAVLMEKKANQDNFTAVIIEIANIRKLNRIQA